MDITERLTSPPVAATVALDADFETRWAAWMARGRVHDRRLRRRLMVWAGALTTGAAIVYAFLRS